MHAALLEDSQSGVGQGIGNEDAGLGHRMILVAAMGLFKGAPAGGAPVPSNLAADERYRPRGMGARASRRLLQRSLFPLESPIEPGRQRLDVGGLDGRAAPDAKPRRSVAMGADIEGDALLLEARPRCPWRRCHGLGPARLHLRDRRSRGKRSYWSASPGSLARCATQGVRATHSDSAAALALARANRRVETADRLRPIERVEIILDAE